MRCPRCKTDNDRVIDSRASADGRSIRRRRECFACLLRYTTYERIETTPLRVIKKNGERVRFERERVLSGILRACEKLNIPHEELEAAAARVETRLQEEYDREVPSTVIGSLVMEELRKLDHVAYVRFASVYREFKDVSQFLDELRPILEGRGSGDGSGSRSAGSRGPALPASKPDAPLENGSHTPSAPRADGQSRAPSDAQSEAQSDAPSDATSNPSAGAKSRAKPGRAAERPEDYG
jgi:transcriptional repressor NrdR